MNRFNLTFNGEIIDGYDPQQVRARLGQLLAINDPDLLQRYFSGDTVVLRSNLERKQAAELYARLRRLGLLAELVKVVEQDEQDEQDTNSQVEAATASPTPPAAPTPTPSPTPKANPPPTASAKRNKRQKERAHRADLAEKKALKAEHAAQLKIRELAVQKALQARQAEDKKRGVLDTPRSKQQARTQKLAEAAEQQAQRLAMEEQTIQRAAVELAQTPTLQPVDAKVRTRLDTPARSRSGQGHDHGRRNRQPGAPNLYNLHPFRNTPEIRTRAEESRRLMRRAGITAGIAFTAALILGAGMLRLSAPPPRDGVSAIAVDSSKQPVLLTDDHLLLLDRAGVNKSNLPLEELGLAAVVPPMVFNTADDLLLTGTPDGSRAEAGQATGRQLIQCELAQTRCRVFSSELAGTVISALVVHPTDGTVFIADSRAGELLKLTPEGVILARAATDRLPSRPALRLDSGLLLASSAAGAQVDVFRYEDEAFGKRLETITLAPPTTNNAEFTGVIDFLQSGELWWVLLKKASGNGVRLYRFDSKWQLVDEPDLVPHSRPDQLVNWGGRILATDPQRLPVQRFNAAGQAESPLVSDALTELVAARLRTDSFIALGWRIGLALCLLTAFASLCLAWLHRARCLVYTSCKEQGAEPVDKLADTIDWLELAPDRRKRLIQRGRTYAALAAAAIVGAIALGVSSLQLSALLIALTGPAVALLLIQRNDPGHIGTIGEQLLLVDHNGLYHLGGGSRIHYRKSFLMIDDVTVFTGSRLLPAFVRESIEQRVIPLAVGGVRVDPTIVTVKLLQGRHPLALGAVAIAVTGACAIALLSLQGIF